MSPSSVGAGQLWEANEVSCCSVRTCCGIQALLLPWSHPQCPCPPAAPVWCVQMSCIREEQSREPPGGLSSWTTQNPLIPSVLDLQKQLHKSLLQLNYMTALKYSQLCFFQILPEFVVIKVLPQESIPSSCREPDSFFQWVETECFYVPDTFCILGIQCRIPGWFSREERYTAR